MPACAFSMSESILLALVGLGGTIIGYLGQLLLARLSKSKKEKDVLLADSYFKLADMTAEQFQNALNQIGRMNKDIGGLERDNRKLNEELDILKLQRKERDDLFESLESRVAALQAQLEKDTRDRDDLRRKLGEVDIKNRALWQYLIALLEHMRRNGLKPLDPPKELQSDPEIMRILKSSK